MKRFIPVGMGVCVWSSLVCAEQLSAPTPANPALLQELSRLENIRQEQRLNEIKKQQLDSQVISLNSQQQSPQLILSRIVVPEQPCFKISQVTLDLSSSTYPQQDQHAFQFIVNELTASRSGTILGKCIGTQSLQNIVRFAQNEIIKAGYITSQVSVSPQDLRSGKLVLSVYPGRLNKIIQQGNVLSPAQLYSAFPIHSGELLNIKALDQGLENLRHNSNLDIDIQVVPAGTEGQEQPGYSNLLVTAQPYRKTSLSFNIDDSGSKSTGQYIGSVGLSINSPFLLNDSLSFNFSHSLDDIEGDHNKSYFGSYQLPFKNYELNASFNQFDYDQYIAGANGPILYSGKSQQSSLGISRLLSRGSQYKTMIYTKAYHKKNRNFIEDIEIEVQRRQTTGWQVGVQHRQYIGTGLLDIGLDYRRGTGALKAIPAYEEQIRDVNGNSLPSEGYARAPLWSADLRFNQPFLFLQHPAQYRLNWRGQYAPKILVAPDRFNIGGRYSVRGFDGEIMLSGDNGHYLQQEISLNSTIPNTQFYAGIDQGWVNGRNSIAGQRYLLGSVLGLRSYYHGFYLDAFTGHGLIAPQSLKKQWNGGFSLNYTY
ncbi:ShlB/FhaC/HecB family hemolysin secretion/activation protein [Acinetobacter radioresistens]|uniref:ShlB/FhaC/HecB family hemolysin secretion/activation protein n=1 Tax=Acinetobacter radioresistens TaxID=40216 RepID=UPI003213AA35